MGLVSDEGKQVGIVHAGSLEACKDACNRETLCNSFSFNPAWGCLLKDRVLDGSELTNTGRKASGGPTTRPLARKHRDQCPLRLADVTESSISWSATRVSRSELYTPDPSRCAKMLAIAKPSATVSASILRGVAS